MRACFLSVTRAPPARKRDDGMSGSTAWHNSCRARIYFKSVGKEDDGLSKREIRFLKSNYSREPRTIRVHWRNGVFVKEPSMGSLEMRAVEQRADDLFLALLRDFAFQGREVSAKPGPRTRPQGSRRRQRRRKPALRRRRLPGLSKAAPLLRRCVVTGRVKPKGPSSKR